MNPLSRRAPLFTLLVGIVAGFPTAASSLDAGTGTIANRYYPTGIPLGGIGAGYIEILSNGTTGALAVNNNWDRPLDDAQGLAWALAVSDGTRTVARALRAEAGPERGIAVPERAFDSFRFRGRFPEVEIQARDADLRLDVQLTGWSPFVPNDPDASGMPVGVFEFEITNTADSSVTVTLAGCWEHVIGQGAAATSSEGAPASDRSADRIGNLIHPIHKRGLFGAKRGGGYGLLFDSGRDVPIDERANSVGEHVLAVETEKTDQITALLGYDPGTPDVFWKDLEDEGRLRPWESLPENTSATTREESGAALAVSFPLQPRTTRRIAFVLTWHMPHLITRQGDIGTFYPTWCDSATKTAWELLSDREDHRERTDEWLRLLDTSSLPSWLSDSIRDSLGVLVTNGIRTRHGAFAMMDGIDTGGGLGSVPARLLYQPGLLAFFPELDTAELGLIRNLQQADGEVPYYVGNLHHAIGDSEVPGGLTGAADLGCSLILQLHRNVAWRGDDEIFDSMYDGARAAMQWCKDLDSDGDGLPEGSALYGEKAADGAFIGTAELWLAALRAADEMAGWCRDSVSLSEIPRLQRNAEEAILDTLWNGRTLGCGFQPTHPENLSRGRVFMPQLLGRWFGTLAGWGPSLPTEVHRRNLLSLSYLSRGQMAVPPLVVDTEGPATSGSIMPFHGIAGLAAPLMSDGMVEEGLDLCRRFIASSRGTPYGPWASPRLCSGSLEDASGLRAAESLVVASLPHTLAGFSLNLPRNELLIGPVDSLRGGGMAIPLFTPVGWFELRVTDSAFGTTRRASLRVVKLTRKEPLVVKRLGWKLPGWIAQRSGTTDNDTTDLRVEMPRGRPGVIARESGKIVCLFDDGFRLREGDVLSLTLVPDSGPYVELNLDRRRVRSHGAPVRALPLTSLGSDRFGYHFHNSTDQPQILRVRFTNKEEESWFAIRDGADAPVAVTSDTELSFEIPASPLPRKERAKWRMFLNRLESLVARTDALSGERKLQSRVLKIRDKIADLLAEDGLASQVRLLLAPESTEATLEGLGGTWNPDDFDSAVTDLRERLGRLGRDAGPLSVDPRVAAMTIGAVLPVSLNVDVLRDDLWRGGEAVVQAAVIAEEEVALEGRVDLQFPPGWSAEANGSLDIQLAGAEGTVWSRIFHVRSDASAERKRFRLSLDFNGQVADDGVDSAADKQSARRYFAITEPLAAGATLARDWHVIGPFPNSGGSGFDAYYDPELGVNLKEAVDGVSWAKVRSDDGYVDLESILLASALHPPAQEPGGEASPGVENVPESLAYAYAYAYIPRPVPGAIHLGVSQGVKVLFNRSEVYANRQVVGLHPGAVSIPIQLRSGLNEVLLKLTQGTDTWGFYAEITDSQGFPIDGLRWSLEGPSVRRNDR